MKFLIQKCKGQIVHDFSFTLLESVRYHNWSQTGADIEVEYLDYLDYETYNWEFEPYHNQYVPVGSIEFVIAWFEYFYQHTPKPNNIPNDLMNIVHTKRKVWNSHENGYDSSYLKLFVKSNDVFKSFEPEIIDSNRILPKGNYQYSEVMYISSEWRAFVYNGKLVGLHNYSGDFTVFPNVDDINNMINDYKSAPVAYTLDVGVYDNENKTFIIEVHDFFSCGLYGFAEHKILPYMFYRWHTEYCKKIN